MSDIKINRKKPDTLPDLLDWMPVRKLTPQEMAEVLEERKINKEAEARAREHLSKMTPEEDAADLEFMEMICREARELELKLANSFPLSDTVH